MIEGDITLQIESFRRMAEMCVTIIEQMATQSQVAGAKISQNLFGPSLKKQGEMANATSATMGKVASSSQAAGTAISGAGQKAAASARGFQVAAAGANQAGHATASFGQRALSVFNRLGAIGNTLHGISSGVRVVHDVMQRFRSARAPVQQVSTALNQQGQAATVAASRNKITAGSLLSIIKASAGAATALVGVAMAMKQLRAWKPPAVPPIPKMDRAGDGAGPSIARSLSSSRGAIAAAVAGIIGLITASFAAVKVGSILKESIVSAAKAETLEVSLDVLVGGAERAKQVIDDLISRSERTPYSAENYTTAGRALIAFGETADSVGEALDRIANISSGIGASAAGFGEIAEIYGKARVQGQLFAEDINQLTGRGIPVISELARVLGVTEGEVKKLGSEGKIHFSHLEQAFVNLTGEGGKFFGMTARLSKTSEGMWNVLIGKIQLAMKEMGKPINDALKPILEQAIGMTDQMRDKAKQLGDILATSIKFGIAAFEELGTSGVLDVLKDSLIYGFKEAVNILYGSLMGIAAGFGTVMAGMFKIIAATFTTDFWAGMAHGLAAFGLLLRATLLRAAGEMMDSINTSGFLGRRMVGDWVGTDMRLDAKRLEGQAAEQGTMAKERLSGFAEAAGEAIGEVFKDIGPRVKNAYQRADGLFDTSGDKAKMGEVFGQIRTRMEKLEADRKAAANAEKEKGNKGTGTVTNVTAPTATARNMTPGLFASAVNLLMGRSPHELLLDEVQKQTGQMEQMNKTLTSIENKTGQAQKAPVVAVARPVDMTPRFA